MEYVELGTTKEKISRIAFGCAPMGGHDYGAVNDEDSIAAVHRALDLGINLFDTADVYGLGHAEEVLGRALQGRRHEAFIATKVGVAFDAQGRTRRDLSPSWVRAALDASLSRLGVDVIDLYQIHWPDPETPLDDTLGTLTELQRAGKVRYLGVCNFSASMLGSAMALARVESIQIGYNLADWLSGAALRGSATEFRLTPLTYNSLAQGMLSGKYANGASFHGTDRRQRSGYFRGRKQEALAQAVERLRSVAREGRPCASVALRWILDSWPQACAIVGIKNALQVADAVSAMGWNLEQAAIEWLKESSSLDPVST